MFTVEDEKLIEQLCSRTISVNEFIEKFSVQTNLGEYLHDQWEEGLSTKNSLLLQTLLLVLCRIYTAKHPPIWKIDDIYLDDLRSLLYEDWHRFHEEIIDVLTSYEDPETEKALTGILYRVIPFYEDWIEDGMVFVWVKILWYLARIKTPTSVETLLKFKDSPYEWIRENVRNAYHQYIDRNKEI